MVAVKAAADLCATKKIKFVVDVDGGGETNGKFTLENFALDAFKDIVAKVADVDMAKVAVDGFNLTGGLWR